MACENALSGFLLREKNSLHFHWIFRKSLRSFRFLDSNVKKTGNVTQQLVESAV